MSKEPEFESVEAFVEFLTEEERETFTTQELNKLAFSLRTSSSKVRVLLVAQGFSLALRTAEKAVRGFTANSHNRWEGNPCGGGSGWEQINGFAGRNG